MRPEVAVETDHFNGPSFCLFQVQLISSLKSGLFQVQFQLVVKAPQVSGSVSAIFKSPDCFSFSFSFSFSALQKLRLFQFQLQLRVMANAPKAKAKAKHLLCDTVLETRTLYTQKVVHQARVRIS